MRIEYNGDVYTSGDDVYFLSKKYADIKVGEDTIKLATYDILSGKFLGVIERDKQLIAVINPSNFIMKFLTDITENKESSYTYCPMNTISHDRDKLVEVVNKGLPVVVEEYTKAIKDFYDNLKV